jgi:hypothetical protein
MSPVPAPYEHPVEKQDHHHSDLESSEDQFKQHRHSSKIDEECPHDDYDQKYPKHIFSFLVK